MHILAQHDSVSIVQCRSPSLSYGIPHPKAAFHASLQGIVEDSNLCFQPEADSVAATHPSHCPPKTLIKTWSKQQPICCCAEAIISSDQPCDTRDDLHNTMAVSHGPANAVKFKCDAKLELILHLLHMVKEGRYLTAMDKIAEMDSKFLGGHPHILFELWRFEVLRVAATGAHSAALQIVRKKLAPIVNMRPDLFNALQV